jgi:anti-sigma regulatory factor (Ser/Thr protein kinase)
MAMPHKIGNRFALVCEEFVANTVMHGGNATYVQITVLAQTLAIHISIADDGMAFTHC